MVRMFNPETWELTDLKEIFVNKNMKLNEFGTILQNVYGLPVSLFYLLAIYIYQREEMEITKINSPWYFNRVQLPYEIWVDVAKG